MHVPSRRSVYAHLSVIAGLAAATTGCINASEKIATSLTRYGMDATQARCVGNRLEANLTIDQLQQLSRAAQAVTKGDTAPTRLTVGDLVRVSSQFNDVRVPLEVSKAAIGCGVLNGPPPAT